MSHRHVLRTAGAARLLAKHLDIPGVTPHEVATAAERLGTLHTLHETAAEVVGEPDYLSGSRAEHEGRTPQPDIPAGPRNTPEPSSHERAEHEGRVPQPGIPTGPRQTVPALPSSRSAYRPVYNPQTETYSHPAQPAPLPSLSDLLTPGSSPLRLGVKPQEAPGAVAGGIGAAAASLVHAASQGAKDISQDVAQIPKERVHSVLGRKTLGAPTVAQLVKAAAQTVGQGPAALPHPKRHNGEEVLHSEAPKGRTRGGGLRVNKGGKLTIPATRQAAQKLAAARQFYAKTARPDASGLSPAERAILPYAIRAHKQYPDIPISVLMAQDKQESGFNPLAESSAGAFGTSQFIPSTAASYGVKRGNSPAAIQSQLTGQAHLLHDDNFSTDPQGALSDYSGGYAAGDYNNPILVDAKQNYSGLDRPTNPNPKALAQLQAAKGTAQQLGIPVKAGDVERGPQPKTVFVRADGEGVVQWAQALLGTQEGSRLQLKWAAQSGVSAAEPWCSEFIAAGMARRGLPPPSNPAYSGTWLEWKGGQSIGTNLAQAKPGDIIVFGPTAHTAHVGLYIGNGQMISGNYGNEVAQAAVADETSTEPIAGIVRPHYKGGKVAVQESAVLPGAGIGPSGELVSGPAGAGTGEATGGTAAPRQRTGAAPLYTATPSTNPLLAVPSLNPSESSLSSLSPEEVNDLVSSILKRKKL